MLHRAFAASFILLLTLTVLAAAQNWQASGQGHGGWHGSIGDNAAPNIPTVHQEIDNSITAGGTAAQIATRLSNAFNNYWDEAWNVVVTKTDGSLDVDVILYAWAYLKHWFWKNGYRDYCIVIWKQWQGQQWRTYDSTVDDDASNSMEATSLVSFFVRDFTRSLPPSISVWQFAQRVKLSLDEVQQLASNTRYSVVAHQMTASITEFGARFKVIQDRHYFYREVRVFPDDPSEYRIMVFAFDGEA